MDTKQRTSIILHGHFYQPPRENPETGIIPKQPSATPSSDWNERIYDSCYDANCHSRYLDNNGKIIKLINNYSYISFNFGHTLLSWIKRNHEDCLENILSADRASVKRLGHGNAIAQGFNHTILPLDNERDAKNQIEWGLESFQYYFKRDSEGLWLPECGINSTVVDYLAEAGIKFVILSPWQCDKIEGEDGSLTTLASSPAPYTESFILTGKRGGTINAFFYNPTLAEQISFGHILRSADALYDRLLEIRSKDSAPLIHTATDGEIYGHHEAYGDMALAALIEKVNTRDDFIFDNYGSYLESHPSKRHAILKSGEDDKGTSWSCSHGVSRWYKDCGCNTGGEAHWNQRWRTPLRDSLTALKGTIDSIFDSEIKKIFSSRLSSTELLRRAGTLFIGKTSAEEFTERLKKEFNLKDDDRNSVARLLYGMMNSYYSFTSCGWFFSDISGIEPRQDIKYALYAISIYQEFTEKDLLLPFLYGLKRAKSNIKSEGDGLRIAQDSLKELPGRVEAALYFYLNRTVADISDGKNDYGLFKLEYYDDLETPVMRIKNKATLESYSFTVLRASTIDLGTDIYITERDEKTHALLRFRITNDNIPPRVVDEAIRWGDNALAKIHFAELIKLTEKLQHYAILINKRNECATMETSLLENLGLALKVIKSIAIGYPSEDLIEYKDSLNVLISFITNFGRSAEIESLRSIFGYYLDILSDIIKTEGLNKELCLSIVMALTVVQRESIAPDLKKLQNALYPYKTKTKICDAPPELLNSVLEKLNFK